MLKGYFQQITIYEFNYSLYFLPKINPRLTSLLPCCITMRNTINFDMWDAICPDTSYSAIATQQVGAVAQQAGEKTIQKYKHLDSCHLLHSSGYRDDWSVWTKDN